MSSKGIIFDLDNTLIDTRVSEVYRAGRQWNKVFQLVRNEYRIDPYMLKIVSRLKENGVRISVVSNAKLEYCYRALDAVGLHFDYVIGFSDTINNKPNPEPIYMAKALMGQPDIVVGVGDDLDDMKAYQAAGVRPILFTKYTPFKGQFPDGYICEDLPKLSGIINNLLLDEDNEYTDDWNYW